MCVESDDLGLRGLGLMDIFLRGTHDDPSSAGAYNISGSLDRSMREITFYKKCPRANTFSRHSTSFCLSHHYLSPQCSV